jgi:predicted dehydrogenase
MKMPDTCNNPPEPIDRREFMKTVSAAGLGLAAINPLLSAQTPATSGSRRRRYAIVGTGSRHEMYREAITRQYKDYAELTGLCDLNAGRVELSRKRAAEAGVQATGYAAADFEKMIRETTPDTIIVTTVDGTHDDYIVRALEAGCDVVTEKPMTTTHEKCQRILDARQRTGRRIRVTFNYRYSPPRTQVKELLMEGAIGDVLSVDFHWLLNTIHGADYFRRWHSQKKNSGGLMLHKATHHFDLVNWWLSAVPQTVTAMGKRDFYTPVMAGRMGLKVRFLYESGGESLA